jgi:hypothetical protein
VLAKEMYGNGKGIMKDLSPRSWIVECVSWEDYHLGKEQEVEYLTLEVDGHPLKTWSLIWNGEGNADAETKKQRQAVSQ